MGNNAHFSGVRMNWGISHRSADGKLIARHINAGVPPAASVGSPIACWHYLAEMLFYALLLQYHRIRVTYAEKNKDGLIPEYYRSGEPAPRNIPQALKELCKFELRRILPNGPDTKHNQ